MLNAKLKKNIIRDKAYKFALHIIKLVRPLPKETASCILGRQLLRSGTSVGANIEEALGADSKKDFSCKMSIAKREARESKYWLQLIVDSELAKMENGLIKEVNELVSILTSIVKTSQKGTRI